jgi:hypothetical protein
VASDAIDGVADFWAMVQQPGIPTSSPHALDADSILAGQAALADHETDRNDASRPHTGARGNRYAGAGRDAETL